MIAGNNFQVIRLDNNDEQSLTHTENQIFSRNESEEDN